MFKKFSSFPRTFLANNFSTYYKFQDSFFNFAVNISGKNILDGNKLPEAIKTIGENYEKGINRLIVKLKENNDENDVIFIANQIKQLREKYPDLQIQGWRYPMMFNQKTKKFLHNEFLFGLKASQMLGTHLFPHSFFFVESNDFFRSMINPENKEEFEGALFNLDMLEDAQKMLEFANLVYMMKYEDGQMNTDNLKQFFNTYTSKNVAFDLELNRAFVKEPLESKKKMTSDFIKFIYGFEPRVKAITLHDFDFTDEKISSDKSINLEENTSIPHGAEPTKTVRKVKRVNIGDGVIDFKLVFDLIKISKFHGVLIFPEYTPSESIERVIGITKENEFEEQNEKTIIQFLHHKAELERTAKGQPGTETMF